MMLKNNLFIRALDRKEVERPPVWMMRQAGRYLPEYRALQDKYDFFTRCRTPELASEITVQPIRRFGFDAAILFSDILVVPQAMNIPVEMKPGVGPWLPKPVRTREGLGRVIIPEITDSLGYVLDAVRMTKEKLDGEVPLIGFAGSPWTVFCYCVEGQGSKDFSKAKAFSFQQPELAHKLLQKLTDTTIFYLKEKVKAGCDAVQLFDSWGGMLSPKDYGKFSWRYLRQIVEALAPLTRVIVFAKGCWFALEEMAQSPVSALGVDWSCRPETARKLTGSQMTLQGNLDPARLFSPPEVVSNMVREMADAFGTQRYIVNLGHGILPGTPLESVQAFVDTVKG